MRKVTRVLATHNPRWNLWPDTKNTDYSDILRREYTHTEVDSRGEEVEVTDRYYPVFLPYILTNDLKPRPRYPGFNNKPEIVGDTGKLAQAGVEILKGIKLEGTPILCWGDALQCFHDLARRSKRFFPVRVLVHVDDSPGACSRRTFPVSENFTHLLHAMLVYDFRTGETVPQAYSKHGIPARNCILKRVDISDDLLAGFQSQIPSIKDKISKISDGKCGTELAFVGNGLEQDGFRSTFISWTKRCENSSWKFHGKGMRDGVLETLSEGYDRSYAVGALYSDTLFSPNAQLSSVLNKRVWECAMTGVVQLVNDRHGELRSLGLSPWVDFVHYDYPSQLPDIVKELRKHPRLLAGIAASARENFTRAYNKLDPKNGWGKIYAEASSRLW